MIILPSLEIVPAKYNSGTLLSQIPIDGTGDFTVSRTTSPVTGLSTRVNSLGLIETVNDNVPRLDYPLGGAVNGCPALLVEPSAQNLLQRSEEFNDAYWGKASGGTASAPVVTPNVELAPDGTNNADRVVFALNGGTTSTDLSSINSATLTHSAASFTSSVYIRTTDGSTVTMTFVNADGTSTNRTITPTYQRITYTSTGAGTAQYRIRLRGGVTSNSASVAIWGAQYEAGSVATSYIPTTTQAITRGADIVRKTGITSLIGQSEGTVYFEVEVTAEARDKWIFSIDSASNSFIQCWVNTSGQISVQIQNAGSVVMTTLISSVLSVGYHKLAFAYNTATNGCEMFIDGVQNPVASRTITGAGLPAFNNFSYGGYLSTITATLKGHVRAGAIYPNRLTNTKLALLTSPYTSYSSMASALSYTLG